MPPGSAVSVGTTSDEVSVGVSAAEVSVGLGNSLMATPAHWYKQLSMLQCISENPQNPQIEQQEPSGHGALSVSGPQLPSGIGDGDSVSVDDSEVEVTSVALVRSEVIVTASDEVADVERVVDEVRLENLLLVLVVLDVVGTGSELDVSETAELAGALEDTSDVMIADSVVDDEDDSVELEVDFDVDVTTSLVEVDVELVVELVVVELDVMTSALVELGAADEVAVDPSGVHSDAHPLIGSQ